MMSDIEIKVYCTENEGNSTLFEVCDGELIMTTYSREMKCELVTVIDSDKAKRVLIALIDEL